MTDGGRYIGLMNNFMSAENVQFNENTCLVVLYFYVWSRSFERKKTMNISDIEHLLSDNDCNYLVWLI